jgi:lipid-A-disaccharide synthase
MKLYLVAGEASGDLRGAELMRALRESVPDCTFLGAGGPKMQALAADGFFDWAHEAVVGLWDVLKKYGYFKAQFDRILSDIVAQQPDALILIDYPGFNLRLAKAARRRLPLLRIIYYISPQVWAWHRERIPEMARFLDLMLCLFPFEKPLYEASGLRTEFVGHPLLDSLAKQRVPHPRDENLIALLPGSRGKEVRRIFPVMIESARLIRQIRPDVRVCAAAASETRAREMATLLGSDGAWCEVKTGAAYELMQRATAGMVCSGTATLEAAYFGLPMVILYRVAWLTWEAGRRLVQVPHLGMPNILAGREIIREFLQNDARPDSISAELMRLIESPAARQTMQDELAAVIAKLGEPGAARRAATAVLSELAAR